MLLGICLKEYLRSRLEIVRTLEYERFFTKRTSLLMSLCILANEVKSNLNLANDAVFIIKMLLFRVFCNIMVHT